MLGGCTKALTGKGNLKNHQNTYHKEIVDSYIAKLENHVELVTKKEKEIMKHIKIVHNLLNRGIKGRGKGRKVEVFSRPDPSHPPAAAIPMAAAAVHAAPYPTSLLPQHGLPQLTAPFYARPNMHFGAAGFPPRDMPLHGPYGMLDSDQLSDVSSVPSPVMHAYEDMQGREMAFGERMY
ncbi:hypothetical protein VTI74DRAFT_10955 [Chaetomium olivicolor]